MEESTSRPLSSLQTTLLRTQQMLSRGGCDMDRRAVELGSPWRQGELALAARVARSPRRFVAERPRETFFFFVDLFRRRREDDDDVDFVSSSSCSSSLSSSCFRRWRGDEETRSPSEEVFSGWRRC